jgi:hypothetical protein
MVNQLADTIWVMGGNPTRSRIIHAREESLADINGLIARSKAHWSWPERYLDKALPLHRISPAYVGRNYCFEVLEARDKLIAFFSVVGSDTTVLLDNLWCYAGSDWQRHRVNMPFD